MFFINKVYTIYIRIFDWAAFRSERSRHRWHNLFYNLIAFYCDFCLAKFNRLKFLYRKYTKPYGLFDSEENC